MSASNYFEDRAINALRNTNIAVAQLYASLHTADPGETGANEVTGGSYARQAFALDAPSSGTSQNSAVINFAGMPAATVVAIGIWDAVSGGNCIALMWLGGVASKIFVADDTTTDLILSGIAHSLTTDDRVVFVAEDAGTLPTGITAGTIYFVLASGLTTVAFKISTTSGGSAVDITARGSGKFQKVVPNVVSAGNTFQIAAGGLVLTQY